MSEQPPGEEERAQGSVFGNLPESRPGRRSPRRDKGKAQRSSGGPGKAASRPSRPAAAGKARVTAGKARTTADEARSRPQSQTEPARPHPEAEPEPSGGLEEIAWAGVAAAAEAATLGVRLANRALEALRGNSEKG